jgi:hypothetical protein
MTSFYEFINPDRGEGRRRKTQSKKTPEGHPSGVMGAMV